MNRRTLEEKGRGGEEMVNPNDPPKKGKGNEKERKKNKQTQNVFATTPEKTAEKHSLKRKEKKTNERSI